MRESRKSRWVRLWGGQYEQRTEENEHAQACAGKGELKSLLLVPDGGGVGNFEAVLGVQSVSLRPR
jgi:hypothetical protein